LINEYPSYKVWPNNQHNYIGVPKRITSQTNLRKKQDGKFKIIERSNRWC
jgi:hypothetical protein